MMTTFKISLMKQSNVCVSLCEKYLQLGSSATVEKAVSCFSNTVHHFGILLSSQANL